MKSRHVRRIGAGLLLLGAAGVLELDAATAQDGPTPTLTDTLQHVDTFTMCQDEVGGPGFLRLGRSNAPTAPETVTVVVDVDNDGDTDQTQALGGTGNPTTLVVLRPASNLIRVTGQGITGEVLVDFGPCGTTTTTSSSSTSSTSSSTTAATGTSTSTTIVGSSTSTSSSSSTTTSAATGASSTTTTSPGSSIPRTGGNTDELIAGAVLLLGAGLIAFGRREHLLGR